MVALVMVGGGAAVFSSGAQAACSVMNVTGAVPESGAVVEAGNYTARISFNQTVAGGDNANNVWIEEAASAGVRVPGLVVWRSGNSVYAPAPLKPNTQ